jgi:hypothetical protein
MSPEEAAVRLFIYESARAGRVPTPAEIGRRFSMSPRQAATTLQRLQDEHDAIVLLPDSPYIWMAEPFSAVPTDYPVIAESGRWFGNCVWDALAIASLVEQPCRIPAACPESGEELVLTTSGGALTSAPGIVHFAMPPARWWESIGFT